MFTLLTAAVLAAPVPAELADALKAAEPAARVKALKGLSKLGPEAVPSILSALKDEDAGVRQSAAYALTLMKVPTREMLAAVRPALADADANVRRGVMGVLGRAGADAVPLLVAALGDADVGVRQAAVVAVQEQLKRKTPAEDVLPVLDAALKDAAGGVKLQAVATLARCGPAAAPILERAAADADAKVRAAAVAAMAKGKPDPAKLLAVVSARLAGETDAVVRKNLVLALGACGPDAVPHLLGRLRGKDPLEQLLALKALEQLGPDAAGALPAVVDVVKTPPSGPVRFGAVQVLAKLPADVARPRGTAAALAAALDEDNDEARALAAHALGEMGPAGKEAVPALTRAKASAPPAVRAVIEKAMEKLAGP